MRQDHRFYRHSPQGNGVIHSYGRNNYRVGQYGYDHHLVCYNGPRGASHLGYSGHLGLGHGGRYGGKVTHIRNDHHFGGVYGVNRGGYIPNRGHIGHYCGYNTAFFGRPYPW